MEEFFTNGNENETLEEINGLLSRCLLADVFKYLFGFVLERKVGDQAKYLDFLSLLIRVDVLQTPDATNGVLLVLNDIDDLAVDAPLAVSSHPPSALPLLFLF